MIWVQGVDVEFASDVFGTIGAHDIEGEGSQSGEVPWFVSDTALIFEEADVPDVVMTILLPPAQRGGRRRTTDLREVLNAILYLVRTGCN